MTSPERASLESLRAEVQAGFAEMRALMETRRLEEVRVSENLSTRIALVESRVASTNAISASRQRLLTVVITILALTVSVIAAAHGIGIV